MGTYLGIDLGTSAIKAIIVADSGEVLARARAAHPASRRGLVGRVAEFGRDTLHIEPSGE